MTISYIISVIAVVILDFATGQFGAKTLILIPLTIGVFNAEYKGIKKAMHKIFDEGKTPLALKSDIVYLLYLVLLSIVYFEIPYALAGTAQFFPR